MKPKKIKTQLFTSNPEVFQAPWESPDEPSHPMPDTDTPLLEAISREALRERERCVQIVWDNRGKCASNQAALALMAEVNGRI